MLIRLLVVQFKELMRTPKKQVRKKELTEFPDECHWDIVEQEEEIDDCPRALFVEEGRIGPCVVGGGLHDEGAWREDRSLSCIPFLERGDRLALD